MSYMFKPNSEENRKKIKKLLQILYPKTSEKIIDIWINNEIAKVNVRILKCS